MHQIKITKTLIFRKSSILLGLFFVLFGLSLSKAYGQGEYITKWNVVSTRNSANTVTMNTFNGVTSNNYNFTVDWGDGTVETGQTGSISHTYSELGDYTVTISGDFFGLQCNRCSPLVEVVQWGDDSWLSFNNAFNGATRLTALPTTAPDLTNVTDMASAFEDCRQFNQDISDWDVSNVTDFSDLFKEAYDFNQPLNAWDVSSATNMRSMFEDARAFNQDLSSWNTGNVTDMANMFYSAGEFDGDVSTWNTASVTNMTLMFRSARAFNQDVSSWNTANVINMAEMFRSASVFNQPLNSWNTASVLSMSGMFNSAIEFNQDLDNWVTSSVNNMSFMFNSARAFEGNVSSWDVSNVTNMESMFSNMDAFNGDLSSWQVGNVTNMIKMFSSSDLFNSDISSWDVSNVTDMEEMFSSAKAFNQDISNWVLTAVNNITRMFSGAQAFNQPIGSWNTSSITNMAGLFRGSPSFNQPLANWDVSNVTDMSSMFSNTEVFNQDISNWNTGAVTTMFGMFEATDAFNQSLNSWDVSNVTTMQRMFSGAKAFNQPLNNWNTTALTDIKSIFSLASSFNQDLSNWNVSSVIDFGGAFASSVFNGSITSWDLSSAETISGMFARDSVFTQDISAWNTASVTNMSSVFSGAVAFNQDISNWDVSSVTFMSNMFQGALAFNQPLNTWNVTAVTTMESMFSSAESFNQPLNNWDVSAVNKLNSMFNDALAFDQDLSSWRFNGLDRGTIPGFDNSGLSQENYDKFLIAMSENPPNISRQTMRAEGLVYCDAGEARQSLIDNENWTFRGDRQCGVYLESASRDSDTQITLTFTSDLKIEEKGEVTDFQVKDALDSTFTVVDYQDGTASDNQIVLTVNSLENAVSDLTITYTKTTSDLRNLDGTLPLRNDETGVIIEDVTFPTLVSADRQSNTGIVVKFSEPVTAIPIPFFYVDLILQDEANVRYNVSGLGDRTRNDAFLELTVDDLSTASGIIRLTYENNNDFINDLGNNPLETDPNGVALGAAPTASDLSISGKTTVGQVLTANYTYSDSEGDAEEGSTFQWYNTLDVQDAIIHRNVSLSSQVNNGTDGDDQNAFYDIINNLSYSDNDVINDADNIEASIVMAFSKLPGDGGTVFSSIQDYNNTIESLDDWSSRNNLRLTATSLTPSDVSGISTKQEIDSLIRENNISLQSTNSVPVLNGSVIAFQLFSSGASAEQGFIEVLTVTDTDITFNVYIGFNFMERPNVSVPIVGATEQTYTLIQNELGKRVFFEVFPANANGTGAAYRSAPVGPVEEGAAFITTWEISSRDVNRSRRFFNGDVDEGYAYNIDWGDGTVDDNLYVAGAEHTYTAEGTYTIKITGRFPRFYTSASSLLKTVEQWGDIVWESMEGSFVVSEVIFNADDLPDLSNVTSMKGMFDRARIGDVDFSAWDVSNVEDMSEMFAESDFNGNISSWDVSSVTNMSAMFQETENFNGDISSWNTSSVTNMGSMFKEATAFNQPINDWNVSSVTDMTAMFMGATLFNQNLNSWNVGNVTDMSEMFRDAQVFNTSIDAWDVSSVTEMERMFSNARAFNQDIDAWDVSSVTRMNTMFNRANSFNQDLNSWDVSNVESFTAMFQSNDVFNGQIGNWDVSNATRMERMFEDAHAFDQDISNWQPTKAENLTAMFRDARVFNQDIGGWRFPNADRINQMFYEAIAFNQDISSWETGNIVDMSAMFEDAVAFNQDIGSWDVSLVRGIAGMFEGATAFNQDISNWQISESLSNMSDLFKEASAFDQDLSAWNISNITRMSGMFDNAGMSIANYDATLIGWAAQEVQDDVRLGAEELNYCAGIAARQSLIDDYNWTFEDDTQNCIANVTIANASGNEDDGNITVTLTSDAFVVDGFTVDVSTADGTATAGTDYTAVTAQTVSFAGTVGETQNITIGSIADTDVESNETLTVNMGNLITGANNTVTITDEATITINNDDEPVVAFTSTTTSNSESTTSAAIEVSLNQAGLTSATVDYTITGTATSGTDYTLAGGTLTFAAGDVVENISLAIIDDALIETDETVVITLSNPSGANLGTNTVHTYNIVNNDAQVTIEDVSQFEDGESFFVTATLEGNIVGGFSLDVSTSDGTATVADDDYIAISGRTLLFSGTDGESKTFDISPEFDQKLEADEAFTVSMSNLAATSASVVITDQATMTIINDDKAAVSIADAAGNEGDGPITLTATLDNAVQGGFTVAVATVDGTATIADSDYAALTETLTFVGTAGETQSFTVRPTDDQIIESDETLKVSMSDLGTSLDVDITDGATVTIVNDDFNNAPTDITLSTSSIAENNALDATIGSLSTTDADADDTHSYNLATGTGDTDNASFIVDGMELKVNNTSFNFEDRTSYSVRINTDDGEGASFSKAFTISVTNVNESPFTLSLTNSTIEESDEAQEVGGILSLDPDDGDTFTYSLVTGQGDTHNSEFSISGTTLNTAGAINFEEGESRSIRINVTDAGGLSFDEIFTINIEDVVAEPVREYTQNVPGGDVKNVFSPNGDGINETWVIEDILDNPFNEVKIFAQGGKLIYSKINYSNDWAGTFKDNPVPDGTYYYEIIIYADANAVEPSKVIKGFLTIIRNR